MREGRTNDRVFAAGIVIAVSVFAISILLPYTRPYAIHEFISPLVKGYVYAFGTRNATFLGKHVRLPRGWQFDEAIGTDLIISDFPSHDRVFVTKSAPEPVEAAKWLNTVNSRQKNIFFWPDPVTSENTQAVCLRGRTHDENLQGGWVICRRQDGLQMSYWGSDDKLNLLFNVASQLR